METALIRDSDCPTVPFVPLSPNARSWTVDNPLLPGELAAAPLADQFAMEDIDIDAIDSRDLVPDDADPRVRNLTAAFD